MAASAKRFPYNQWAPDARALDVVGDKWTLLIVRDLLDGPMRFVRLQERLPGISTEQLRTRLNQMVDAELLTRTRYREAPPRVDYELTEKARDLVPILAALAAWGNRYVPGGPRPGEADADGAVFGRLAAGLRAYGLHDAADSVLAAAHEGFHEARDLKAAA